WGARFSVEWVKNFTSPYTINTLTLYCCKLEQMLTKKWGRRVTFSRGFPRMASTTTHRRSAVYGKIKRSRLWHHIHLKKFQKDLDKDKLVEINPGEFADPDERCTCWLKRTPENL